MKLRYLLFALGLIGFDGASQIVAVSDATALTEITGTQIIIPNVLANDYLNNVPATLSNVVLTQTSIDPNAQLLPDGSVQVNAMQSGEVYFFYKICEINNPENCSSGYVVIDVGNIHFDFAPQITVTQAATCANPTVTVMVDHFPPTDGSGFFVRVKQNNILIAELSSNGIDPVTFTDLPIGLLTIVVAQGDEIDYLVFQQYFPDPCALNVTAFDAEQISVYPNPVTNLLNISLKTDANIQITDLLGKTALSKNLSPNTALDVSNLSKGLYFAKVDANGKSKTLKIIKQ